MKVKNTKNFTPILDGLFLRLIQTVEDMEFPGVLKK